MKRTTAEFAQVLDRLELPKAGRALVDRIRASEPARRVNGATSSVRAGNNDHLRGLSHRPDGRARLSTSTPPGLVRCGATALR